jgi:hypothetical protein
MGANANPIRQSIWPTEHYGSARGGYQGDAECVVELAHKQAHKRTAQEQKIQRLSHLIPEFHI